MTIEKLAFKDYQELKYIQKIDLLLIIEFLQKDRKQWINQYSKAHNDYVHLQKELEQLKEIEKEHQRINGDLRIEIKELKEENQKYKEVIDKAIEYIETKRIREKAIIDIDVLEGILKEVE